MRAAVPFALALLALALLLERRHDAWTAEQAGKVPADLRVFSTGLGLAPESPLRRDALSGVWAGRHAAVATPDVDGLGAVAIDVSGALVDARSLATRELVDGLASWCGRRRSGELVALTLRGRLDSESLDRSAVDEQLARLGAQRRPWSTSACSWILLVQRQDDGWQRLGEAWSSRHGLSMNIPVGGAALAALPPGGLARSDGPGRSGTALLPQLEGIELGDGLRVQRGLELDGARDTLLMQLPAGASASVSCQLGDSPGATRNRLTVALAALARLGMPQRPVTVSILADGEPIAETELDSSGPLGASWQPWQVDLPTPLPASLELRAASEIPVHVLWGTPVVLHDPEPTVRPPRLVDDEPRALNGRALPPFPEGGFRFLVGGHLQGRPGRRTEGLASTFERAIPELETRAFDFFVSLGDCYRQFEAPWSENVRAALTGLSRPVFNTIGNHEAERREDYERAHGPGHGAFLHGSALCVFLDTERDPWNISGEQLAFLARQVARAEHDDGVRQLLVFGHKVVFAPLYRPLANHLNADDGSGRPSNFSSEVLPLLRSLAETKTVAWFAGDVGLPWSAPLFWHRHGGLKITFVATGVGDLPRDLVLQVEVRPDGELGWEVVPLAGGETSDVRGWGPARWRELFPDEADGEGR